jgi:hypothetical protein
MSWDLLSNYEGMILSHPNKGIYRFKPILTHDTLNTLEEGKEVSFIVYCDDVDIPVYSDGKTITFTIKDEQIFLPFSYSYFFTWFNEYAWE